MNVQRFHRLCGSQFIKFNKFRSAQSLSKASESTDIDILPKQDALVSQASTGITIASLENYSPVTKISVAVKAGSRYESDSNIGIVHFLSNCSSLSTGNISSFALTRNFETIGAKLGVTSTRDHLIYNLECKRDNVDSAFELLSEVITNPAFKTWEINEVVPKLRLDRALHKKNPEAVLLEALHKAAYRGGLSHSLYTPSFMIGKHSSEMLHTFVKENFTVSKSAIAGLGVTHDHLEDLSKHLKFNDAASDSKAGTSKFTSGEARVEKDIPFVHTAIVAEAGANVKETLSLGVLQCLLGLGSQINLSNAKFAKLEEAASKCTKNPFFVSGLNINYSDTGLFGIYIVGAPNDMNALTKATVTQMREACKNISEAAVTAAKHQLKAKLMLERETSGQLMSTMATEVSLLGQLKDVKELIKSIDDLKAADIAAVCTKVMKQKPAIASVGRLHSTPYLDELL